MPRARVSRGELQLVHYTCSGLGEGDVYGYIADTGVGYGLGNGYGDCYDSYTGQGYSEPYFDGASYKLVVLRP